MSIQESAGTSSSEKTAQKISAASALATALGLAAGTPAYGAIQYTDLPDVQIGPNASYNLDLNNDTVMDFVFQHQTSFWSNTTTSTHTWTTSTTSGGRTTTTSTTTQTRFSGSGKMTGNRIGALNRVVTSGSDIQHLSNGDNIGSAANWGNGGYMAKFYTSSRTTPVTTSNGGWHGPWIEQGQKFVGLELQVGPSTFYGWARFSVNDINGVATLYDYAYEDSAETPIEAGAIPEFGTLGGMALGAAALLAFRRRKKG